MTDNLTKYVGEKLDTEYVDKATPFITALAQFKLVVDSCFGQQLNMNYTNLIKKFMDTYRSLDIILVLKKLHTFHLFSFKQIYYLFVNHPFHNIKQ